MTTFRGVIIDAFFEDDDDPEAHNGLAIVIEPDADTEVDLDGLVDRPVTITIEEA